MSSSPYLNGVDHASSPSGDAPTGVEQEQVKAHGKSSIAGPSTGSNQALNQPALSQKEVHRQNTVRTIYAHVPDQKTTYVRVIKKSTTGPLGRDRTFNCRWNPDNPFFVTVHIMGDNDFTPDYIIHNAFGAAIRKFREYGVHLVVHRTDNLMTMLQSENGWPARGSFAPDAEIEVYMDVSVGFDQVRKNEKPPTKASDEAEDEMWEVEEDLAKDEDYQERTRQEQANRASPITDMVQGSWRLTSDD